MAPKVLRKNEVGFLDVLQQVVVIVVEERRVARLKRRRVEIKNESILLPTYR